MAFYRLKRSASAAERWTQERIVDNHLDDGIEAPPPAPFVYVDIDKDVQGSRDAGPRGTQLMYPSRPGELHTEHKGQPFKRCPPVPNEVIPGLLEELPTWGYSPLDSSRDEIRLLALIPHRGEPDSMIQCDLLTVSLVHDNHCYLGIRNTRGHPSNTSTILTRGQKKVVSRNVELFLRNFRVKDETPLLYIREICFNRDDPEEKKTHYTDAREDWVFAHSCRMLDMDDFMEEEVYQEASRLAPLSSGREKSWRTARRDISGNLPVHYPMQLGQFRGLEHSPLPHRYLPLDIVAGETRLVVLPPVKDRSDPLVAHLAHEPLFSNCIYECLSYTWGSMQKEEHLLLNGQSFHITHNLAEALRAMRGDTMAVLWIDAICINQDDAREKSRQVPRMYTVYNNAESVLSWIGPSDEESDIAMDFVTEICRATKDPTQQLVRWTDTGIKINFTPRIYRAFSALYKLFTRPYFTRLWVVQEIAMASNPTIFCGAKKVGWPDFQWAANMMQVFFHDSGRDPTITPDIPRDAGRFFEGITHVHRLSYQRYLQESRKRASLLHLALSTQYTSCTDPRDRLYGLWDLANDTRQLNMKPDYEKPLTQVYIDFVKAHVECHKSLDIICATQLQHIEGHECFPSWCPDWRHKPVMHPLVQEVLPPLGPLDNAPELDKALYRATRDTAPAYGFYFDDRTLVVGGIHIDTIDYVVEYDSISVGCLEEWITIARKRTRHTHNGATLTESEIDEQFWSMLFGQSCGVQGRIPPNATHFELTTFPPTIGTTHFVRWERLMTMLRQRQLVFSKKGYMALAPYGAAETGMHVSLLLGCSVPVLLQEHENHYHFRGSVFVQGWMKGEMLDEMEKSDEEVFQMVTGKQPFQIQ